MKERIVQPKKVSTDSFSIPALSQPTRGFGLESPGTSSQAALNKTLVHDISRIPLRCPQTKLTVNQPGDIYEQEADTVAQQVMGKLAQPGNPSSIQRQELPEEEEELQMKSLDNSTLQRQELPEEEEELQMKPMVQRQAEAGMAVAPDLEASINQARGGGQRMADNIRKPMEQAFGADFSGVKVHTDGQSDQLNRSIQARAFTTGEDVFFGEGEYNPGNSAGQELIAHELTHVVQQNKSGLLRRKSDDPNLESFPLEITSTLQRMEMIQCAQPASKADALLLTSTGYVSLRPPSGLTPGQRAGGFTFQNRGNPLPPQDTASNPITYTEYDVNPYDGIRRDAERVVSGSDGRVWYTGDHYTTFTEIT